MLHDSEFIYYRWRSEYNDNLAPLKYFMCTYVYRVKKKEINYRQYVLRIVCREIY